MKNDPHKHHPSSEEEFMDALEKLEQTLESHDLPVSPKSPHKPAPKVHKHHSKPKAEFLLSALEEAAADIDRFMESKHDNHE